MDVERIAEMARSDVKMLLRFPKRWQKATIDFNSARKLIGGLRTVSTASEQQVEMLATTYMEEYNRIARPLEEFFSSELSKMSSFRNEFNELINRYEITTLYQFAKTYAVPQADLYQKFTQGMIPGACRLLPTDIIVFTIPAGEACLRASGIDVESIRPSATPARAIGSTGKGSSSQSLGDRQLDLLTFFSDFRAMTANQIIQCGLGANVRVRGYLKDMVDAGWLEQRPGLPHYPGMQDVSDVYLLTHSGVKILQSKGMREPRKPSAMFRDKHLISTLAKNDVYLKLRSVGAVKQEQWLHYNRGGSRSRVIPDNQAILTTRNADGSEVLLFETEQMQCSTDWRYRLRVKLQKLQSFFASPESSCIDSRIRIIHLWELDHQERALGIWQEARKELLRNLHVGQLNFSLHFCDHGSFLGQTDALSVDGWYQISE